MEADERVLKDWQAWDDCIRSFIRANHLSRKFTKHAEEWDAQTKLPLSAYERTERMGSKQTIKGDNCPACGGDMFSVELTHYKCRHCKEQFNKRLWQLE